MLSHVSTQYGVEVCERQLRLLPACIDWDFGVRGGDTLCLAESEFSVLIFLYCSSPASILECSAIGSIFLQSSKTGNKTGGMQMRKHMRLLTLFLVAVFALFLGAVARRLGPKR